MMLKLLCLLFLSVFIMSCEKDSRKEFNLLSKPLVLESKLITAKTDWLTDGDSIVQMVFKDACGDIYIYKYKTTIGTDDEENTFFKYLHYKYDVNDTIW